MTTSIEFDVDRELAQLLASQPDALEGSQRLYEYLRDNAPVYRLESNVFVSRYADVKEIVSRPQRFGSDFQGETTAVSTYRNGLSDEHRKMFDAVKNTQRMFLPETDGADHRRRRQVAGHLFTPRRIADLRPLTQQFVDEVIDETIESGVLDIDSCSWRVPARVMATLLGIPIEDIEMVVGWCDDIEAFLFGGVRLDELEASYRAHNEIEAYIHEMIADHRSGRRKTQLMEVLLSAQEGEVLSEAEVANMILNTQFAGFETTRILLSGGLHALLSNRDQWERLVASPELSAAATEELLRYVSPVQWMGRVPHEETTIGTETVVPGDTIYVLFSSANHDPRMFEDPQSLDLTRPNAKQHLAFSHGIHHCLGAALARLEGEIWFESLARKIPDLSLRSESVEYTGNAILLHLVPYEVAF
jgi:cytochrome P450